MAEKQPISEGLNALKTHLPRKAWTGDTDIIAPHLVEWRDLYQGHTPLMLMPASTSETQIAVKICAQYGVKIVPQGGNTGLVGGQTPQGEVLMSMRRMNKIRDVNPLNNAVHVEAGVTLSTVQDCARTVNRIFPLSLASQDSCTVGGIISTNAGGVHVLKYGTTKDLVFGVEAVLANGDVHAGLTSLRKDNTGYDINRLFLGAEGTLGIVTAASLKLFPRPAHIQRVMIGVDSPTAALQVLEHCRVANHLAMFEVIPAIGLDLVTTHIPNQRSPFQTPHPWYIILDWDVSSQSQGDALAERVLTTLYEKSLMRDAIIAQSDTQSAQILALREHMSAAQKHNGGSIKFDITVPLHSIPDFLEMAGTQVQNIVPHCRPVAFGHFGDGNIHYNIAQPLGADKHAFLAHWTDMSECVFDVVAHFEGSISAEHGIGIMKRGDLARRSDPVKLTLLHSIKNALDPNNIMNPRVLV